MSAAQLIFGSTSARGAGLGPVVVRRSLSPVPVSSVFSVLDIR